MTFIETLNSVAFRSGLLVAVPVLFAALSALKLDITKLPRLAQPVLPFLLAALPVLYAQLEGSASIGAAFLAAVLEGVGAIGLYHVGKRVLSPGEQAPPAAKKLAGAGVVSLLLAVTGCAALQPAKEPARELWYAAELLCQQDLTQYAEVQAISGAAQLINEVCSGVDAARPYVEVLLREQQTRGADPLAWPRANAQTLLAARRGVR